MVTSVGHKPGWCDVCRGVGKRGLGICYEFLPWGLARYVCEQGHEWIDPPPHVLRERNKHTTPAE
jgi:hypothetical protein